MEKLPDPDVEIPDEAGISPEEQEDIRTRIEAISAENRIEVNDEVLSIPGANAGIRFPVIINAAAAALIVVAIVALAFAFRVDERSMLSQSMEYSSVEGKLIQELRRQSLEQISSKDREIESVRQRLTELEQQRDSLVASIDERIKAKEQEYENLITQEVEAERTRLISEGVSEESLNNLLAAYEAERRAYYEQQLDSYKAELDQERVALEENIRKLRAEYTSQIQSLEQERQALLTDFKSRESQLMDQLEQQTEVIRTARSSAQQNLEQAQQELRRLSAERDEAKSVENQILGFYDRLRQAVNAEDTDAALEIIRQARNFLNQDSVVLVDSLASRRVMDLFFLDSFESLLLSQSNPAASLPDIGKQLESLSRIQVIGDRAESVEASNPESAVQLYTEIINALPEVATAHEKLMTVALDEQAEAQETQFETWKTGLRDNVSQTLASIQTNDFSTAAARYGQTLGEFEQYYAGFSDVGKDLVDLGFSMATEYASDPENSALSGLFQDRTLAARQALLAEINAQVSAALQAQRQQYEELLAKANLDLAQLEDQYQSQVANLEAQPNAEVGRLQAQLNDRDVQIEELTGQINRARDRVTNLQSEVDQLSQFQAIVNRLDGQYASYTAAEDQVLQGSGDIVRAKLELENFLGSGDLQDMFPGFSDRLRRYDTAFVSAGRQEAMADAIDILSQYFALNPGQRAAYLQSEMGFTDETDTALRDFIQTLMDSTP